MNFLTPDEVKLYKEAFAVFDKTGRGKISIKELGIVMRSMGFNPTEVELTDLIAEADIEGNGEIDFNAFVNLMGKKSKDSDLLQKALEAFKVFDKHNKGFIHINDLKNILKNIGEKMTDDEVNVLIADVDLNTRGELDYKLFLNNIFSNL